MNKIESMATQQHRGEEEVEKALVLWNISNCPIPDGHDPLTVVQRIQTAVENSGHVRRYGEISITAIGNNLTEIPGEDVMRKLSSIGISLKHSHGYHQKDLYDWAEKNPPPGTMMVIDGHEQLGWLAFTLSHFEDNGYRIILAYPQRDLATPFPRIFSKLWDQRQTYTYNGPPPAENVSRSAVEWDWDALISDEQEVTTPTTSLVVKHDKFYGESPWSCSVCSGAAPSFEDFTTHLKSVEHEFREWDRHARKYGLDRTNRNNLPFGRSQELDLLLTQEMLRCQEMLQQCRLGGFKPKDRPVTLERVDPRGMNEVENMTTQQQHEEKEVEKAFVLWDMGNCPIPDGHDPLTVVRKIQMAVEKSGHVSRNGEISITAIGSKLREIPGEDVMRILSSFEISFKHSHR
ncbi:uncharacterized protein LOC108807669 [Raphanus sativus]|uniref:Uncharacterized protein LOC108807669 n=1 Tax=Raphanus sativus TaxID=3726 RepID=A0A6J0JIG2_RAPSA|nr:uncharacterized protein LOC108807669 [Raphanus sativus]